jgi:hypothetical protein
MKKINSLFLFVVIFFLSCSNELLKVDEKNNIVDYSKQMRSPVPSKDSQLFKVEIFQNGVWVTANTYGDCRKSNDPYYFQNIYPWVHWSTICINEATQVKITRLNRTWGNDPWTSATCEPARYNITPVFWADSIKFTIQPLQKVYVRVNSKEDDAFFIFANPLKPAVPTNNCKYFGPGYKNIGVNYQLSSSESTVYLDEGAWVEGSFDLSNVGGDVSFIGPGVISGAFDTWENVVNKTWSEKVDNILIHKNDGGSFSYNITLDGPTLVRSPWYCMYLNQVSGVKTIKNTHLISPWTYNTDGFNVGQNANIQNCFAFNNDDKIHAEYSYSQNYTVSDCVLAGRNAFLIGYGYFTDVNSYTSNISYIDCILQTNRVPFRAELDGSSSSILVDKQYYNNITVNGNVLRLFDLQNCNTNWGSSEDRLGNIKSCFFNNITLNGTQQYKSILKGKDSSNKIGYIEFNNLYINGVKITNSNQWQYFDIDWATVSCNFY